MKKIAITFDDGPNEYTNEILDILNQFEAKATFFIWAELEAQHQAVMTRMVEEGHQLGNHTFTHPDLTKLTADEVRVEVEKADEVIKRYTDKIPHLLRPPYGYINEEVEKIIDKKIALWTADSKDWSKIEAPEIIQNVQKNVTNNDILLLHCFEQTVIALPEILTDLTEKKYQFVTVDDILS